MAYQEIAVASVADIPAAVYNFATSHGWVSGGVNTIHAPGSLENFVWTSNISGTNNQNKDVIVTRTGPAHRALCRSPKLFNGSSVNNPIVPNPSKLHCFAGLLPQPYLAIVIEFGFNLYRHIYCGMMEKLGSYDGGEVLSCNNAYQTYATGSNKHDDNQFLFSARHALGDSGMGAANDKGGVSVIHPSNPNPWRQFSGVNFATNLVDQLTENVVFGGYNDGPLDSILARAKSSYAGSAVLVPFNLYCPRGNLAAANFAPIGRPAGVRAVRMDGLDPGKTVQVGSEVWRCFPEMRKSSSLSTPNRGSSTSAWPIDETSYYAGLAYLES